MIVALPPKARAGGPAFVFVFSFTTGCLTVNVLLSSSFSLIASHPFKVGGSQDKALFKELSGTTVRATETILAETLLADLRARTARACWCKRMNNK